jgi:uncharacterized protein (DUF2141 family)
MRAILIFFLLSLAQSQIYASTLTINITNIQNTKGTIKLGLFNNGDLWLEKGKALQSFRKITDTSSDKITIVIDDLDEGAFYGLALHHDTNGNDKMDLKMFPPGPSEGYAFSNIGKLGFTRPAWEDCKYSLKGDKVVNLSIIYP